VSFTLLIVGSAIILFSVVIPERLDSFGHLNITIPVSGVGAVTFVGTITFTGLVLTAHGRCLGCQIGAPKGSWSAARQ
jgi:hypothetical protein